MTARALDTTPFLPSRVVDDDDDGGNVQGEARRGRMRDYTNIFLYEISPTT